MQSAGDTEAISMTIGEKDPRSEETTQSVETIEHTAPKVKSLDFNAVLTQRYSSMMGVSSKGETNKEDPVPIGSVAIAEKAKEEELLGTGQASTKRVRTSSGGKKSSSPAVGQVEMKPTLRYSDLGGIEEILREIEDLVERPLRAPEIYTFLGVEPPRGILLHGPPGSGKSSLAMAIAGELGVALLRVSAPELVSGMSGESEGRIRELFEQAKQVAPCILFLDEIDAITPKRETAQREMERRIVAQLLTCMDELSRSQVSVVVIGATNRPDSLDSALRRAGRFDRELRLGIPSEEARFKILHVLCARMRLTTDLDLHQIARNTPGYVGADLKALTQEAANVAIRRIFTRKSLQESLLLDKSVESIITVDQLNDEKGVNNNTIVDADTINGAENGGALSDLWYKDEGIEPNDFEIAMTKIQPSAKREGFAVVPDTRWEDIGALQYVRDELRMAVVEPIRHPEMFASVGITAPAGVLLWGPPGCGKTLLAKAVANESHSNFISVKGPELLNKYVGESERAVRQVFERARHSAPCVVFFDELDALCPRRSDEADSASSRVVNQLLTEMDGLEGRRQVFILAATNRPDIIDPAMTRPGRLDKLLYVNLPTPSERLEIIKAVSRQTPWASEVDLSHVASDCRCNNFSGADLAALVREASLAAVRESLQQDSSQMDIDLAPHPRSGPLQVYPKHIESAFARVSPSVSPSDLASYEKLLSHR